jgi:hypothetical protein
MRWIQSDEDSSVGIDRAHQSDSRHKGERELKEIKILREIEKRKKEKNQRYRK